MACLTMASAGQNIAPAAQPGVIQMAQRTAEPGAPFPQRIRVPEFPDGVAWVNTKRPLQLKDLRGKFVLLDFWTYCCINCHHVFPELKKLEKAYPKQLVVIGVHTAKFETEKNTQNIKQAILRHQIEHPVVNDAEQKIWTRFAIRAWPSIVLIDPEGYVVGHASGEFKFETLDRVLKKAIPHYRRKGSLDEKALQLVVPIDEGKATPLRFPGKVLADEEGGRLFIADTGHNRIVVASLDGKLIDVIGTGKSGRKNGAFDVASFNQPQGMALAADSLYVADTENHSIRKVGLKSKLVSTIAGTGVKGDTAWPGMTRGRTPRRFVGRPSATALNSPWALWIHKEDLYIAMAGPHQIWRMPLSGKEIGPYAGNGREDIVDGPLLPKTPYQTGFASFAQPSGLASDEQWLYVADSEGSSIRAVPFDPRKEVKTVVGTANLRAGRLFAFGDTDGKGGQVRLQHVLGIVHHQGKLYIADTYNNKIKQIDLETTTCRTIAGTGQPGGDDRPAAFDEPAGITYANGRLYVADTNNHLVRTVDLTAENRVGTLRIDGLKGVKSGE